MADLIDRQAAIDALCSQLSDWNYDYNVPVKDCIDLLKNLPSARPERKTGRWIHDGYDHPHGVDWMHCSVCGRREPYVPAAMTNYCPSCGAKMEVEHDND